MRPFLIKIKEDSSLKSIESKSNSFRNKLFFTKFFWKTTLSHSELNKES